MGQISCKDLEVAGTDGSIPPDTCLTVQELAAVPCCGTKEEASEPEESDVPEDICSPCGPDKEMTKMDGVVSIPMQGMLTCLELSTMGRVAKEDEDWCLLIRPFVQKPCGCKSTGPTTAPSLEPASTPDLEVTVREISGSSTLLSFLWMVATAVTIIVPSFFL
jgi:hypothetical protein